MLYTRLSVEGRTIHVEKMGDRADPISAKDAVFMGKQKNADYVLIGSITMLGTMISTDARFIHISQAKPLLTFNEVGQNQGDIIVHIDHLTTQINESITPSVADQSAGDIHIRPEKLEIPGIQPKNPPLATPSAPAIIIAPQPDKSQTSLSYWKSKSLPVAIQGISIADIDGDGASEAVFIGGKHVYAYRYQGNQLQEIKTFSHGSLHKPIHIDVADINQNGRAEIFLTDYFSSRQRLKSVVLEWNGQDFDIIAEHVGWYMRVLKTPASGPLLLGQKRGPGSSHTSIMDALFDQDVHEMKWQGEQYAPAARYVLPKGLSLFDFSLGDASNNGQNEIVAFSRNDYITVYDQTGNVAWESNQAYGGNQLFFVVPEIDDAHRTTNYYLPQRIHITDIDNDGFNEIIVLKNHDTAGALSRVKAFKEGHIDCLSYDDLGAQVKWQTRKISGYISDYVVGDLNNDGMNEIVFSVVEKKKLFLAKGKSYIVSCMPVLK